MALLILRPTAEVGQLRLAQLLDGQPVGVALPAVDVSLVMTHLLLVTPGQVIPGDLGQVSEAGQCHVIWTQDTLTMGSGYPRTLQPSSVVTPSPEYTRKLRGRTSGKSKSHQ